METKTGKSETVSSQLLDYIGKEGMRPGDTLPSEDSLAKMFEVKTINGSVVMAKMAGMESIANTTSVVSITNNTINIGVATFRLLTLAKNLSP